MRHFDLLVVGAGLEGLFLGVEAAAAGRRVLVVEKEFRLGGRYGSFRHRGFTLERGIHLARSGPHGALGETLFRQGDRHELRPLGPSFMVRGGRVSALPLNLRGLLGVDGLTLSERMKVVRLMIRLRSTPDVTTNLPITLDGWLASQGVTGGLADRLRRMAGTLVMREDPGALSAGEVLDALRRAMDLGVAYSYPAEGWGAVVRSAVERFLRLGGRIERRFRVVSLTFTGGRVDGAVSGDGRRVGAEQVVWTANPESLLEAAPLLADRIRPSIEALGPVPALVFAWALDRPVSATTGLWWFDALGTWAFFPSNLAPSVAAPGGQILLAVRPLRSGPAPRPRRREVAEVVERTLAGVFPGFPERVRFRRILQLPRWHGTGVGVQATRLDRPPIDLRGVDGLSLVGDASAAPGLGHEIGFVALRAWAETHLPSTAAIPAEAVPTSSEAGTAITASAGRLRRRF